MKVLVCGGRDYANDVYIFGVLDTLNIVQGIDLLVHGDAQGADKHAKNWANEREVCMVPYPADWKKHGKAAGPIRNRYMFDSVLPDLVIAFPGGTGTADMVSYAKSKNCPVMDMRKLGLC